VVSVAAELRFVLWEASGANHNRHTRYKYTRVFSGLPQCLQVKAPSVYNCVSESGSTRNAFFIVVVMTVLLIVIRTLVARWTISKWGWVCGKMMPLCWLNSGSFYNNTSWIPSDSPSPSAPNPFIFTVHQSPHHSTLHRRFRDNEAIIKFINSLIHSVICLTTGPTPLPKRFLHIVRSRASSFKWEYPFLSLRSSSSFLRLLPRLLVTSIIKLPTKKCAKRELCVLMKYLF
jgi:hypothetical protein